MKQLTALALLSLTDFAAPAYSQPAPFYQGKQIRVVVGFTTGGFYDQKTRRKDRQVS